MHGSFRPRRKIVLGKFGTGGPKIPIEAIPAQRSTRGTNQGTERKPGESEPSSDARSRCRRHPGGGTDAGNPTETRTPTTRQRGTVRLTKHLTCDRLEIEGIRKLPPSPILVPSSTTSADIKRRKKAPVETWSGHSVPPGHLYDLRTQVVVDISFLTIAGFGHGFFSRSIREQCGYDGVARRSSQAAATSASSRLRPRPRHSSCAEPAIRAIRNRVQGFLP